MLINHTDLEQKGTEIYIVNNIHYMECRLKVIQLTMTIAGENFRYANYEVNVMKNREIFNENFFML